MKESIKYLKGKDEISSLHLELEDKLKTTELKMTLALERNAILESDLVRAKKRIEQITHVDHILKYSRESHRLEIQQ